MKYSLKKKKKENERINELEEKLRKVETFIDKTLLLVSSIFHRKEMTNL